MRKSSAALFVAAAAVASLIAGIPLEWDRVFDPASPSSRIFFELRIPRLLFVFACGASLAGVGACYQVLFLNPLAEPYLLGVSSAATLGVAVAEVFAGVTATSFLSQSIGLGSAALVTIALALLASSRIGRQPERIALFGMGVNFVLSSALFLLLSFHSQQVGGGSMRWLFGQIPWVSFFDAFCFAVGVGLALALLFLLGRSLDAMSFGDGIARTLGTHSGKTRRGLLALTSALMAWIVSFTGSIGFVGLVVPHLVRMTFKPSSFRSLLAMALPLGGAFLALSDAVSRSILPPMEFPIGVITTLLGGPLFLVLLWKR